MNSLTYNVTTTDNGIIETLTIDGRTYERKWVKVDYGCRSEVSLDFCEYFEDMGFDETTLDFIYNSIDNSFFVPDIFDALED